MPAVFPNAVRIYTAKSDLVDTVLAEHVNLLQEEVSAVETTLGTGLLTSSWTGTFSQSSTYASLTARLTNIEAGISANSSGKLSLTGGTLTGALTGTAATFSSSVAADSFGGRYPKSTVASKTASFTLTAALLGSLVLCNSTSTVTVTIPTDATLSLDTGSRIDFMQTGTGTVTLAGATGVTLHAPSGVNSRDQYCILGLVKIAADTWVVIGDTAE